MKNRLLRSLAVIFIASPAILNAQVGIGTTAPDASSILDIQSTEAGILIPRMTEVRREITVISPQKRSTYISKMMVTEGFHYYDWHLIGLH